MKNMKKLASLLLALVMVFALAANVFAADSDATSKGSITISNAANGETYTIYKLFDATVSADGKSVAYTGNIPAALNAYFTKDAAGNISETDAARAGEKMSDGLKTALKTWAETAIVAATDTGNGSAVVFSGLDLGYYVVTTTQGEQLISVDTVDDNITIFDKNSSTPKNLNKKVDDDNVKIGDTATYTVSFETANYDGSEADAKKIVSYTIKDTLPDFLKDVNVKSIIVDNDADTTTTDDQIDVTAQFNNKQIVINWYDEENEKFLYENGAKVVITYTAVVTEEAAVAGAGNTNTVTLSWTDDDGNTPEPSNPDDFKKTATIYTYALALKKVNDEGTALADATFQLPFYVKEAADTDDGAYIYAGTTAGDGLTNTLTTPADGVIIVKGLEHGVPVEITETAAPAGYNKLTSAVSVTPVQTTETTTKETFYIDEDGKVSQTGSDTDTKVNVELNQIAATPVVVVNKTGLELPTTGGMGTTLFYVCGGILIVAAGVLLITKKRMKVEK